MDTVLSHLIFDRQINIYLQPACQYLAIQNLIMTVKLLRFLRNCSIKSLMDTVKLSNPPNNVQITSY